MKKKMMLPLRRAMVAHLLDGRTARQSPLNYAPLRLRLYHLDRREKKRKMPFRINRQQNAKSSTIPFMAGRVQALPPVLRSIIVLNCFLYSLHSFFLLARSTFRISCDDAMPVSLAQVKGMMSYEQW